MIPRRRDWIPVLLAATAFAVRFLTLPARTLDIDEAFQLFISTRANLGAMFAAVRSLGPQQYPLDYILSFLAARWTTDIHLLRLLPVAWGTLAVVTVYFTGVLLRDRALGWMWAWLLAFSTLHIEYSQTFRPYALVVFLSAASIYVFLRLLLREEKKWLTPYLIFSFLFQMAYPFALVKSALEFVVVARSRLKIKKQMLLCIIAGSALPMAILGWKAVCVAGETPFSFSTEAALSSHVLFGILLRYSQDSMASLLMYAVLFVAGAAAGLRSSKKASFAYLLILGAATAAVGISAVVFSKLFLHPRHLIGILPMYVGFIALGVVTLAEKIRWRGKAGSVVVLALASFAVFWSALGPLKISVQRQARLASELRGMADYLTDHIRKGDSILFGDPNFGATALAYFDPRAFLNLRGIKLSQSLDLFDFPTEATAGAFSNPVRTLCSVDPSLQTIDEKNLVNRVREANEAGHRVWFLYLPFRYVPEDPWVTLTRIRSLRPVEQSRGVFVLKENP